jgi:uncharacterized integral membrane protein (TIGR00698 family)
VKAAAIRFGAAWPDRVPGLVAVLVIAAAANFLGEHYGAPVMLFALLLGLAMNFLCELPRCSPGIDFASRPLLRIGVALLGCRITLEQMISLGWPPVVMVVATMTVTILASILVARWMGFNGLFGLLSGGATAICGASAALALSAALPSHPLKERATLFTVIGVSSLSTLAMILYPTITRWFGLDDVQAGTFIGATIHDVAQVVGAGYAISPEAGDVATIVKLLRVAMLLPIILATGFLTRARDTSGGEGEAVGERPPLLPWFVLGFLAIVAANSVGILPAAVAAAGQEASRWALVTAIAAIGVKARIKELIEVGLKPVILMVMETVFLAAITLAVIWGGFL